MKQSQLFTKTRKEAPKDEVAKNAELLIRGGYIHKEMAGVYTYLPLGLRVLNKILTIIREEMNAIGGQEVLMTTLQDPGIWKESGRWDDAVVDNWFKTTLKSGTELGIANTHEEALTALLRQHITSYKDLPVYVYQIQTKFRNELRAKSGIMRGREFLMKDLYSFSHDEKSFREFYEQCAAAYMRIFARVGLGDRTFRTFASGGSFSKFSDEFQTLCDAGEDIIYLSEERGIAVNKEVYTDEVLAELGLRKDNLKEKKAIEVGNIFPLGERFTRALNLSVRDEKGEAFFPYMGSYGIGPGRLMGTIVESFSDEAGIIWPDAVAPFAVHLLMLPGGETRAQLLQASLEKQGLDVLVDDRDCGAGTKFAEADLLGIPHRLVVSAKTEAQGMIEYKRRGEKDGVLVSEAELLTKIVRE